MEMVHEISANILNFSAQFSETLGIFFIPAVILATILLIAFAKNSYRLLKVALPVCGMGVGAMLGATYVAPLVEQHLPIVGEYVNPVYLTAIVLAAVLALLCYKFHTFAVLVIGAYAGYTIIGRVVKDLLLSLPFINQIANDVIRLKSYIVGTIICMITAVVVTFIIHRYFKKVYVITTCVILTTATLGIASVLLFANTSFADIATISGAVIGLLLGCTFCHKQMSLVYLDY